MCVHLPSLLDISGSLPGFLDRTDQDLVLEHQRDGDEDEVEEEHGKPESLVHPPLETGDAKDHERQHAEEDRYAAHHAHRVHLHGSSVDQAIQQPRYRKPAGRNTTENPARISLSILRRFHYFRIYIYMYVYSGSALTGQSVCR